MQKPKISKEQREINNRLKEQKKQERLHKTKVNQELKILKYMLKDDVKYYHHDTYNSFKEHIKNKIKYVKESNTYREYNSYFIDSFLPICHIGCLWRSLEFDNIYEVPLTGEYEFYIMDSGHRGEGSFNYITCKKKELPIFIPKVNPGGFPPITI